MKKRLLALGLAAATMVSAMPVYAEEAADGATGSVYYLNFKPEQDAQWQELAAYYTEQTGVPVTVTTAASGQYETMLTSEMGSSDAPTMFQVNGPVGLKNWKDYCYDLSGSALYGELTSDDYALSEDGAVYGIAYVIESYGIITNKTLLEQAGYTVEDIQSFEDLEGKTTANTLQSTYATMAEQYGATVTAVDDLNQTIQLLLSDRIDATLNSDVTANDYMTAQPDADIKIAAVSEDATQVAIPMRKGEETATLRAAIDEALNELSEEGVLTELSEKYFGIDISQAE